MLLQDIRYAWRSLTKTPGFTAIAVACLALGIGINTTIFSVVDGVILKPYPYPDADRILVVHSRNQRAGVNRGGISYLDYRDFRDQTTTFDSMAAFTMRSLTISDGTSEPERYVGMTVTWNLFELLGTPPILGRNFGAGRRPSGCRAGRSCSATRSGRTATPATATVVGRVDLRQRSSAHRHRRDAAAIRVSREHASLGHAARRTARRRHGTCATCRCSRG